MNRVRYMIVDHPETMDKQVKLSPDGRSFLNVPPVHRHMQQYHWVRMDGSTIFVKGWYHQQQHEMLLAHPSITVLPATFSRQSVKSAIQRQGSKHHGAALTKHAVPYTANTTTSDLVDWMAENESLILDHDV